MPLWKTGGSGEQGENIRARRIRERWHTHQGEDPVELIRNKRWVEAAEAFIELSKDQLATPPEARQYRENTATCLAIEYGIRHQFAKRTEAEIDQKAEQLLKGHDEQLNHYEAAKITFKEPPKRTSAMRILSHSYGIKAD